MCAPHRLPSTKSVEISEHRRGIDVALSRIDGAGFEEDFVELQQAGVVRVGLQIRRQLGEFLPVFAERDLVENFSQAVDVCLRRAGAFRRNVARGSNHRLRVVDIGHQPDVRQLRLAPYEDDVRWLDVAMHQALRVKVLQR